MSEAMRLCHTVMMRGFWLATAGEQLACPVGACRASESSGEASGTKRLHQRQSRQHKRRHRPAKPSRKPVAPPAATVCCGSEAYAETRRTSRQCQDACQAGNGLQRRPDSLQSCKNRQAKKAGDLNTPRWRPAEPSRSKGSRQ